jgi:hypothetical protein
MGISIHKLRLIRNVLKLGSTKSILQVNLIVILLKIKKQYDNKDRIIASFEIVLINKSIKRSDGDINTQLKVQKECPKIEIEKKHPTIES